MIYSIESKPTMMGGVQFRSRLEARWAAFFTLLKWPWLYEPVDLGEWSPDFIIDAATTLLVEVKPILAFDEEVGHKIYRGLTLWQKEHPEKETEGLLLGLGPQFNTKYGEPVLGWLAEEYSGEVGDDDAEPIWSWCDACMDRWIDKNPHGLMGFCSGEGSYHDRITGGYDGGHHGSGNGIEEVPGLVLMWAQAGNQVQWQKARGGNPEAIGDVLAREGLVMNSSEKSRRPTGNKEATNAAQ